MNSSKALIGGLIEEVLGPKIPLLLLRGLDSESRAHGDIDVLVPQGRAGEACRELADAAATTGWKLLHFSDIGYLCQIVLVHCEDDSFEAVKVDFFSGVAWYGVSPDAYGERIFKRLQADRDGPGAARLAAAATYLQKILSKGFLDSKDRRRIQALATDAVLNEELQALGVFARGRRLLGVSRLAHVWHLRSASSGAAGAVGTVCWFARVVMRHIRFKSGMGTRAGRVIGLSGLDGSGKSTQVSRLFASYARAGITAPILVHLLPRWLPMPHQLARRSKTAKEYNRPYSEPPANSLVSNLARLAFYSVAFLLARISTSVGVSRGRVYIFDRSPIDFFSDLERARISHGAIPDLLLKAFVPKGLYLFLDVPPSVAIARKGELSPEKAKFLRNRYLELMNKGFGTIVDANRPPGAVFEIILSEVDASIRHTAGWSSVAG